MDKLAKILAEIAHLNLDGHIVNQTNITKLGSSCDVYRAWSNKHMKVVAVKHIREFIDENPRFAKMLAREIKVWASLEHENVLPLLGYFTVEHSRMPRLISEWMEDGTMTDYMKTFPRCCIKTQRMLYGIAAGLAYLHGKGVVHADLKTPNVLISKAKTPLLTDFGLSKIIRQSQTSGQSIAMDPSSISPRGTVRWMARDFFVGPSGLETATHQHDEKTDVWAYGMVVYELLTWDVPYADKAHDVVALLAIARGELPAKPSEFHDSRVFHKLWNLCQLCWKDRLRRPTATELVKLTTLGTRPAQKLDIPDEESSITDLNIQDARKVTEARETPSSQHYLDLGGSVYWYRSYRFEAVHYGFYEIHSGYMGARVVSFVTLRVSVSKRTTLAMKLATDIVTWAKLEHECVPSLLGYFIEGKESFLSLVYKQMQLEYGSLHNYMFQFPRGGFDTWKMLRGIASGLAYLHDQGIVNVGLKGRNILISKAKTPLLSFFDISTILQEQNSLDNPAHVFGDAVRWMAVELLEYGSRSEHTKEADIWAFGMVSYELLCGEIPFYQLDWDVRVILSIIKGLLPLEPVNKDRSEHFDTLWRICLPCWERNPEERPTAAGLSLFLSQDPSMEIEKRLR